MAGGGGVLYRSGGARGVSENTHSRWTSGMHHREIEKFHDMRPRRPGVKDNAPTSSRWNFTHWFFFCFEKCPLKLISISVFTHVKSGLKEQFASFVIALFT